MPPERKREDDNDKIQAPSIKSQTNDKRKNMEKPQTKKPQRTDAKRQSLDESVWCFLYCRLSFVCDLMLVIWCFGAQV
jgi:hypothetical protein